MYKKFSLVAVLVGTCLAAGTVMAAVSVEPGDDTIPGAATSFLPPGFSELLTGTIGDGTFGATSGDYDHFGIFLNVGWTLTATTFSSGGDPILGLYGPGPGPVFPLVAFDDNGGSPTEALLMYEAPMSGLYSLVIAGKNAMPGVAGLQGNPTVGGSGTGAGSTFGYTINASIAVPEPSSVALFGMAAIAIALMRRRRN